MIVMASAAIQLLLTAIACFALWRLWRAFASNAGGDRAFTRIVAAGFLVRALAAQVLFWISYLRLPLLRSLQLGDGFWFFAADGPGYLAWANVLLHHGMESPLSLHTIYPSRTFVELLVLFVAAFGSVASVAILLNCAAYLATCMLLLRIGTPPRLPRLVALVAISFGPGTVLWSLQPLKDTLFLFLVVAFVSACFAWQESWQRNPTAARSRVIALAAAILFLIYALAGLRWYFAAIIWVSSALFFFLAALPAPRRMRAMLYGIALFAFMAASVRLGSGSDIVPFLRSFDRPGAGVAAHVSSVPKFVSRVRRGFEKTGGATTIGRPPAVATSTPAVAPVQSPPRAKPIGGPAATSTVAIVATPPPRAPVAAPPSQPALPQTTRGRMITGAAATLLPRAFAQRAGLIDVRGGRGLWLFADFDTVVFELMLLFALTYCTMTLRSGRARVTPLFVLLLLVFVVTAIPLMYSVSNFGTLFRLRQMLYTLMVLMPLTLAPAG